ncbi:ABC transporter ATP-binding protein [Spiroplasma corruscae]|uniref:ABC transporter ATP-binding protein n=1 Tax=Spiroplasma corruscae TaxID=216934 RepID=A0A222EPH6_9MOLU|nr:ABC transporter ATP-binding protein [Spiroplasma corruscae]ASP28410.1 ABC transporter ATP-binding protein [Spiroplasma corruscae]
MISLNEIGKKYGKKTVLDGITFNINKGENIAIIGANGSGKSTLIEIICGIQKQSSGSIEYTDEISKVVGIQFQEGNWPPKTRAIDLIKFFKGRNWKKDEYVNDIFNIFEISEILKIDINKLSLGQRQRLNCFIAIIDNPTFIVIDELITGLDLKVHLKLIKYFEKIKNKTDKTLLIVSHIPDEIEVLCDRIIVLKDGKLCDDITLKEVFRTKKSIKNYLESYFGEDIEEVIANDKVEKNI